MQQSRLMDTPQDYAALHVNPEAVEPWEDGRRNEGAPGGYEWWYVDALCDDGTSIVLTYFPSHHDELKGSDEAPKVEIKVTLPDGTDLRETDSASVEDSHFSTDRCDVKVGPHTFVSDQGTFKLHYEPVNGLGADLTMTDLGAPWRPGTGYIGFGEDDEQFFTWFCAVPRCQVDGTVTVDGQARHVHGTGYHDHQWGTVNLLLVWNHWLWGRQTFDDLNTEIFDLVAGPQYGFNRFPLFFIQDHAGRTIFESTHADTVSCEVVETYSEPTTGKEYPKILRYRISDEDTEVTYTITADKEIYVRDGYGPAPAPVKEQLDHAGKKPSYVRYNGTGDLEIRRDGETTRRSGTMMYEFSYMGTSFSDHM